MEKSEYCPGCQRNPCPLHYPGLDQSGGAEARGQHLINTEISPGWMVIRDDEEKLWLENQHSFSAFELDSARPREHALELLREFGGICYG